jgi:iron complex outermembrane receptor protein
MLSQHLKIGVAANAIMMAFATSAFAQTSPASDADHRLSEATTIEDVVVTARRREESQQDVPVTITTMTGAQIERAGLRSTEDLRTSVPSLNIAGQRRDEAQFYIRGQGPGQITTGQRNFTSVATYFAEVPTTVAGPGVFYDLSSAQVLKGPQGTLFGRNTTGGAVLFEPNHPGYQDEASAKVTLGNHDYREFEGMLNAALVPDKLAVRIAGQISRRDGYTKSVVTGQKLDGRRYEALRASVLFNPTERIESLTIFDYRRKDNSGGSAVFTTYNPNLAFSQVAIPTLPAGLNTALGLPAGAIIPIRVGGAVSIGCLSAAQPGCPTGPAGSTLAAFMAAYNRGATGSAANSGFALVAPTSVLAATLAQQQALGARRTLIPTLLRSKALDIGVTNKTEFELTDSITLKNVIAFRKSRKNESADYDGTPLNFLSQVYVADDPWSTGSEQFTEELQIQGNIASAKLDYILGVYHEFNQSGFLQQVRGVSLGTFSNRASKYKDQSDALFAHVEWNPSELIGLSGGVRQTWDKRAVVFSQLNAAGACSQTIPGTATIQCPLTGKADFDALTYDVTLNVRPTDGVLAYGSFRHGYKSGGINLPAPAARPPLAPDAYQSFEPEEVDSFEIGLKADWDIGIPWRTNVAAFYDKYRNIQIGQQIQLFDAAGNPLTPALVVRNGVKAVNKGVELESTIVPSRMLSLSGFVSYLDAHPTNSLANTVIAGRQFSYQPKWKYGISGVVTVPTSEDFGQVTIAANWSWQSKTFNSYIPSLRPVNPGYGLLNGRIEWSNVFGRNVDFAVFGNNLLDKTYILGGYPIAQLGFDSVLYGEPRMFGASIKVRFGAN